MNAKEQLEQLNNRKELLNKEIELLVREKVAQFESETGLSLRNLTVLYLPTETMGIVVDVKSVTKERF